MSRTSPPSSSTEQPLVSAVTLLSFRLDLLKLRINDLNTSQRCSSMPLDRVQRELNVFKICRKKLHRVIHLVETIYEKLDEECGVNISRAIDSVFWGLKFIKDLLVQLAEPKLKETIEQLDDIIKFVNDDIRYIALSSIKKSLERSLDTPLSEDASKKNKSEKNVSRGVANKRQASKAQNTTTESKVKRLRGRPKKKNISTELTEKRRDIIAKEICRT